MAPPIYNKDNVLHYLNTAEKEHTLNSLAGQYNNELELLLLLNFISTLEKLDLL